jgi:hypothetical protein
MASEYERKKAMEEGTSPVTRRAAGGATEGTGGTASIESARRFLYDEDEPPPAAASSANVPLPHPAAMRGSTDLSKSRDRLNPFMAACMATGATCCKSWKRILIVTVGMFAVLSLGFVIHTLVKGEKEHVSTKHMNKIQSKVVAAGVSTKSQLTTMDSPQYHALHWLANVDRANADSPHLLQRYALAVFFYSTSGSSEHIKPVAGWEKQDDWMTSKGICIWYGVKCETSDKGPTFDGDAAVTALNLADNSVGGSLPSELTALNELLTLDLSNNKMVGTLPNSLENLTKLRSLILRENGIVGSIPSEYGNFLNLRQLHLGQNKLNGKIPKELEHIATLRALGLDNNQFEGAVPDLEDMEKLGTMVLVELSCFVAGLSHTSFLCIRRYLVFGQQQVDWRVPLLPYQVDSFGRSSSVEQSYYRDLATRI